MQDPGDDYFDWLDEGVHRFYGWCVAHWRATLVVVGGTPVLTGFIIGFVVGRYV